MKVVHFGDKLYKRSKIRSVVETLEPLFAEFCKIRTYSDIRNRYLRFLDMILHFFTEGLRADKIIIDVYSTLNFYYALSLSALARVFNVPYVLFLHGGNLPQRHKRSKALVDFMFRKAKHIVAPSGYLKAYFEEQGYEVKYIPNVIETDLYPFKERKMIGPRLLYVRGFGKLYNPQMAVKALAILKEFFPYITLTMLGTDIDGTLEEVTNLIEQLGLAEQVSIPGTLSRAEWGELSKSCDIMVNTPVIDNTPVSVIEGMALGLVVVSTSVGGIPYLLEDGKDAVLVPSDDHVKMAEAIKDLIEHPEVAHQMQLAARQKAENFSWQKIKPVWQEIINN